MLFNSNKYFVSIKKSLSKLFSFIQSNIFSQCWNKIFKKIPYSVNIISVIYIDKSVICLQIRSGELF